MDLSELLGTLEPVQQQAVALVYSEGRSTSEAAHVLAVDPAVVAAALTNAFRHVARWVTDDDGSSDLTAGRSAEVGDRVLVAVPWRVTGPRRVRATG